MLDLIELRSLSGDTDRAWELAWEQLPAFASARARVRALLRLSELATWTRGWESDDEHPVALAERAQAAAGADPALAAECHAVLAEKQEREPARASRHASEALALIEQGARVERSTIALALASAARVRLFAGQGFDRAQLERAIAAESGTEIPLVSDTARYKLAQSLKYIDDFDGSRATLQAARAAALERGDELSLPTILINLIELECWAGNWNEARELGEELAEQGAQIGGVDPTQHVAFVAALTGDETTVRPLETQEVAHVLNVIRLRPLGLLALSHGDAATAHRHFRRALELMEEAGMLEPAVYRVHADAVESAVAAGAIGDARAATSRLETAAATSGIPWDVMAAARSRALVASAEGLLDQALLEAESALEACAAVPMPFERARTLLVKGRIERRLRRKAAARRSLEQALASFEQLGARLWAERAREEVGRVGLRHGRRDELTDTERRVAELAATGLTNRRVAAQLFMSPKTVEANLARAYRKLDIRSRAELGARLARVGEERAQT